MQRRSKAAVHNHTHHFPCLADGLVFVDVRVFVGFLFDLLHDGINSKAEASHAGEVTDRDLKLQRVVLQRVIGASAALVAHRRLTEQFCSMKETCPHLHLCVQEYQTFYSF